MLTNIEARFKSEHSAAVLGTIIGTTIPAPAGPEQLTAMIVWLLSDDASNVNGAILRATAVGRPSERRLVGVRRFAP